MGETRVGFGKFFLLSRSYRDDSDFKMKMVHSKRRFPKARVWPPLPGAKIVSPPVNEDEEFAGQLPEKKTQEHLLELYFTHVHPALPLIHKKAFFEVYRNG
jgi:hypothetical protein